MMYELKNTDNIRNFKLMESQEYNGYIISLSDIINFCEDNMYEFNEFITELCETHDITSDQLIVSFNEDTALYDNDYLEDAIDIQASDITVAAEAYGSNEVLDYIVEESLNGNDQPIKDTIEAVNEWFGQRFKNNMASNVAFNTALGARYAAGRTIAGLKNGVAQGTANAVDNLLGRKIFDKKVRTGDIDPRTGKPITKVYRNRNITQMFTKDPNSAGTKFASDMIDGVRGQLSGDVKNLVRRLIGVTPDGQNSGGIITAINNKIKGIHDEQRNLPPNQRHNLTNTLRQLMGLKNSIRYGSY